MDHILTFWESAETTHFSQITREEFVRRLRSTTSTGYYRSIHPSIVSNVLNWRSIFKSPTSNSLYSVMHDRHMLTLTGWQDKTLRMSDHWNNRQDMSSEDFLRNLYKMNDTIQSHFYISLSSSPGEMFKVDLALQRQILEPDQDDGQEDTQYKDNRVKFDMVIDAVGRGVEFDAVFIWHNNRSGMCNLAIVDDRGWVQRHYMSMADIEVHQYTLWTNRKVENRTHWTVARYNKSKNMWVVQDTRAKADYSDQLPKPTWR